MKKILMGAALTLAVGQVGILMWPVRFSRRAEAGESRAVSKEGGCFWEVAARGRDAELFAESTGEIPAPPGVSLRYNDVQWTASHNSYAQEKDVFFQLQEWRLRSIEFDLHTKKRRLGATENAPAGDWLVYHTPSDDFTNCRLLSDCLTRVKTFHDSNPRHDVITIFFDMEGVGEPGHTEDDLYNLFRRALPQGAIFSPADLMAACPAAASLQEAVTREGCAWPLLSELEGKFLLVVSDGREAFLKAGYDVKKDLVFLVAKNPKASELQRDPNLVFFNMSGPNPLAATVLQAGFVSRCYWLNQKESFEKARELGAHHLATDKIDPAAYPWSRLGGFWEERGFGVIRKR